MSKKKKKRRKKIIARLMVTLLCIVAVTMATFAITTGYYFSKIQREDISDNSEELGFDENIHELSEEKGITNIALFGLDARDISGDEPSRSDSIMIATIDRKNKTVKISSVIRDTYVRIKGQDGYDKINHAYSFGGSELAIHTLNSNFDLDITDFVAVSFYELEKIIDAIDGIEIDVEESEIDYLNSYAREMAEAEGKEYKPVTKAGSQTLSGIQSVGYCRVRYTEGGDTKRAERHRTVLKAIINKGLNGSKKTAYKLINVMIPYVRTSLSNEEIVSLAKDVLAMKKPTIEDTVFPDLNKSEDKKINGIWYRICDLDETRNDIYRFIYGDNGTSE